MGRGANQGTVHGVTESDMTNTHIQAEFISKTFSHANLMGNRSMKDRTRWLQQAKEV